MTATRREEAIQTHILKSDSRGRVKMPVEKREALLDEFERSGMSGQEFARWAGVKYPTFAHWRQQRHKEQQGDKVGKEEPVQWIEAVAPEAKEPAMAGGMVIHFAGGVRVEAGNGRQAAELLMALGVVRC